MNEAWRGFNLGLSAVARVRTGHPALPTTPPQSFGAVLGPGAVRARVRPRLLRTNLLLVVD
eukprot:3168865-Prymnesium_polylepis.2